MNYYIYLTTNLINGKKYLGQHKGEVNDSYLGSGSSILQAIKKYGKENFKKEILKICDTREEADIWEKYFIEESNAVEDDNYYNLKEGGMGGDGWRACRKWFLNHPEEAKQLYQQSYERLKEWRINNPELAYELCTIPFLEGAKHWRETHPEEVAQLMKKVNEKKVEWQQTHPEEHQRQVDAWRQAGSEANSQKIKCITTGEIFTSQSEAARHYKIPQANISKCLKGERKSAGKHPETGEKMIWVRCDEQP